jgi:carboxypeptidase C (cathepsin A)
LNGTFASGNLLSNASTSQIAARSLWHFLQAFLATFPQYDPTNRMEGALASEFVGISLFTESYGSRYGLTIAAYFESQNALRLTDPYTFSTTLDIRLISLGIINGWVDLDVQTLFYPRFAYNNTYSIQAISEVDELNALSAYSSANGCEQLLRLVER